LVGPEGSFWNGFEDRRLNGRRHKGINMPTVSKTALALVLAGGLVGCGGASETQANQVAANASENMAAGASPFSDAETRMNEAMMAAVGTDAGDSWAKKMAVHHQGAVDMSEIVLQQSPRPDVAEMARMTIEKQRTEIQDLEKLFKSGNPDQQSADLYREATTKMHQAMQAATGADVSETFLRKMLEHHRGAVAMSDVALRKGVRGVLGEKVQKIRDDQQKEAKMVEAMLRGETMQHAMQASVAKSAQKAESEPAPTERATAEPKMASKPSTTKPNTTSTAEPKKETPAADPNCTTEHREMGHC
jgi:uncharacterized protein (DUF305 family)